MENERDQTDLSLLQIFVSICNYHRLKLILNTYNKFAVKIVIVSHQIIINTMHLLK